MLSIDNAQGEGHWPWALATGAGVLLLVGSVVFWCRRSIAIRQTAGHPITVEDIHGHISPIAKLVRARLQMIIGIAASVMIPAHVAYKWPNATSDGFLASTMINDAGAALAVAAVVELIYTLYTPEPDEALDPLLLGVAATMLLLLNEPAGMSFGRLGLLAGLALILFCLFWIRHSMAEWHPPIKLGFSRKAREQSTGSGSASSVASDTEKELLIPAQDATAELVVLNAEADDR